MCFMLNTLHLILPRQLKFLSIFPSRCSSASSSESLIAEILLIILNGWRDRIHKLLKQSFGVENEKGASGSSIYILEFKDAT